MKKAGLNCTPLFVFSLIVLCSCSVGDKQTAMKLYYERKFLLKEFKDKSIIKRGEYYFQLSYYKGQSVNTFFFERKSGGLVLSKDTLQYPINEIASFAFDGDGLKSNYSKVIEAELSRLLNEMDRLGIRNVSAAFAPVGVDMKIYFGDYKALLYVADISRVKNERWKTYIDTGEKLDANWYYVKDVK